LDWSIHSFYLPKTFTIPENLPSANKILDYVFQNIRWDREQKKELQKYLLMIWTKINPQKLYEIFAKK
jgi:hypothetical protein